MDSILLTIHPLDPMWMVIAFFTGLAAARFALPPLVGFLVAGFVLNVAGFEVSDFLQITADLGVTMLLFTIGLKLQPQALLQKGIWAVTTLHMAIITLVKCAFILALAYIASEFTAGLSFSAAMIIGFALSFSSTVFAVKILDEMGAGSTQHAKATLTLLIVQDIVAVCFVAFSAGKMPSPWAFALLLLIPARKLLQNLMQRCGHGELLILFGITMAILGADLFELVNLKGDLGALVTGMLFAGHRKAGELAKELLGLKNLFLVGFFLSVGMTALPGWREFAIAVAILSLLPLKVLLYFVLFSLFRYSARTAWQSSLNLANYSEFGLIVGAMAIAQGWLEPQWMAVFAILLSLSFICSAPLAVAGDRLYLRWNSLIKKFDRYKEPRPTPMPIPTGVDTLIFGMGRVGLSIYDSLLKNTEFNPLGVDPDSQKVEKLLRSKRKVLLGDATNPDFWLRLQSRDQIKWVILAMPSQQAIGTAANILSEGGFKGKIAATTRFADEVKPLKHQGVQFAFDIYSEAGRGFVADLMKNPGKTSPFL